MDLSCEELLERLIAVIQSLFNCKPAWKDVGQYTVSTASELTRKKRRRIDSPGLFVCHSNGEAPAPALTE